MTDAPTASVHSWLAAPLSGDVAAAIERLRRSPDVRHVAVMPDVHLANEVCVGLVAATERLIYPQAVGGDIGCGMLAVAFDSESMPLRDPTLAGHVLRDLGKAVPARRRNRRALVGPPPDLARATLSHPALEVVHRNDGALEFATLGSGNHFLELQADEEGRLWLMVHSGSRALGQAIRDHHLAYAEPAENRLRFLDAVSERGRAYLHDVAIARRYAEASRRAMAEQVSALLSRRLGKGALWETLLTTDHNHVRRETHGGRQLWVHRKGAMSARLGEAGVLPGSMGSPSFHVEGRGCEKALCSSAHGAGRALSRAAARSAVSTRDLHRQMDGVWYDYRIAGKLRDEAPSAYKDVRAVLRAQTELVKVRRTLLPVLSYKGV